jgi:hypothetical protein
MGWTIAFSAVGLLVLLSIVAVVVGGRLPREHVATVRVRFAAAPAVVWALLDNPVAAASWRKDIKKAERVPDINGHPAWKEESDWGVVTFELTESVAPVSRTTRIVEQNLAFGGQWEYRLAPSGAGTELTVTERGFVKPAYFRFLAHFVFGYTSTIRDYLIALGGRLGEQVTPEIVASGR